MPVTNLMSMLCVLACAPASAALIVYGSPDYTPGVGGFTGGSIQVAPGGPAINDVGTAIGQSNKVAADGSGLGTRAVRWSPASAMELGNLGTDTSPTVGWTSASAIAINSGGTSAGVATKYEPAGVDKGHRAVRWEASGTAATELGNLGTDANGVTDASAYAINDAGTAVGHAEKYEGTTYKGDRAVRWDGSGTVATELGNLGTDSNGFTFSQAFAINTAGTAAGHANRYDGDGVGKGNRAVRWDASGTSATELGNIGTDTTGFASTMANAINTAGTVAGWAQKYDGAGAYKGERAIRWDASGTVATELGNLGMDSSGFVNTRAFAINDGGAAAGFARKYDRAGTSLGDRAVRWDASDAAAIELGTLGTNASGLTFAQAYAMNDAGFAVGWSRKYVSGVNQGDRAVYWGLDNVAVDLNTLIDPSSGWLLQQARSISDTGWIAGYGMFDPDGSGVGVAPYRRLFSMQVEATAIPEPASAAALALAGGLLVSRRTRRRTDEQN